MPSVFLNTGAAFVPFYESPKEPKGVPAAIDGIQNLTAGFLDENLVGLAAKNAVDYIFNEEKQQYEIDPNYDVFNDPKFKNYKPFNLSSTYFNYYKTSIISVLLYWIIHTIPSF